MRNTESRVKRTKKRKKRNIIISFISILIILISGFFIGSRMSHEKSISVSASNTTIKNQSDKRYDDTMNKRESLVNIKDENDLGSFDPYKPDGRKVAYLTFDDGPSANNTPKILDILKKYNIKATFFVIGQSAEQNSGLVKREISEGHVVGNHTYTHNMSYIYSNPDTLVGDFNKCDAVLKSILGNDYNLKLVRFPGGSFGAKLAPFREAVQKAGYHYIDWNDLTGDAEHNNVPVSNLIAELQKYTTQNHVVILMHDAPAKATTVQALPQVIDYLKSKGYVFDTLK